MTLAASVAGLVICCFIKDPSAPPANRDTIRVNQYIKDTLRLPKLKLFTILSMTPMPYYLSQCLVLRRFT